MSSVDQSLHSVHLTFTSHLVSLHSMQTVCLSYFIVLIRFLQLGHDRGAASVEASDCDVEGAAEVTGGVEEDILSYVEGGVDDDRSQRKYERQIERVKSRTV